MHLQGPGFTNTLNNGTQAFAVLERSSAALARAPERLQILVAEVGGERHR